MKHLLILTTLLLITSTAIAEPFVYVSLGRESKIACYDSDYREGKLKLIEQLTTDGSPGAMGLHKKSGFLFVALRQAKSIATYQIDKKTGKLTLIATKKVGVNPVYISTDLNDKYLFFASYSDGKVAMFPLNDKGELLDEGSQWFDTEKTAHAMKVGPYNKAIFVPHTRPNVIYQFQFDSNTGKLTRNSTKKISAPVGTGPRHHQFHPNGKYVYTADELGSSVTFYSLDNKTGGLTAMQTVSTLPKDFKGKNSCADIEIHPGKKVLYVSNRGHNSIATFGIDEKTGKLTALGQTATEDTPRSFNVSWQGNIMHVAGQKSGKLATYSIDKKTGKLTYLRTIEVGKSPSWVEIVMPRSNWK